MKEYFELKRQATVVSCRCLLTAEIPMTYEEITRKPSVWKRISDDVCCKLACQRVLLEKKLIDNCVNYNLKTEKKKIKHENLKIVYDSRGIITITARSVIN